MHAYTLSAAEESLFSEHSRQDEVVSPSRYWSVRPFGCAVLLGCVDED